MSIDIQIHVTTEVVYKNDIYCIYIVNQTNTLRYQIERFTTLIVIMLHVYTSIYRVSLSKNDIIKK